MDVYQIRFRLKRDYSVRVWAKNKVQAVQIINRNLRRGLMKNAFPFEEIKLELVDWDKRSGMFEGAYSERDDEYTGRDPENPSARDPLNHILLDN